VEFPFGLEYNYRVQGVERLEDIRKIAAQVAFFRESKGGMIYG